jgi:hypothetical protein
MLALDSDVCPTPVTRTVAPLNTYTFLKKDWEAKESVVAEIPTNYETCERDLWMLGLGGCVST